MLLDARGIGVLVWNLTVVNTFTYLLDRACFCVKITGFSLMRIAFFALVFARKLLVLFCTNICHVSTLR